MDDLISRQAAIKLAIDLDCESRGIIKESKCREIEDRYNMIPAAQPQQAECIQDTKAVPDDRDMVCLSERVSATYYDDEHEEWSQKTVTIRDLLDGICDEYTVLPSAQPEYKPIKVEDFAKIMSENTLYGFMAWHGEAFTLIKEMGFEICKKTI